MYIFFEVKDSASFAFLLLFPLSLAVGLPVLSGAGGVAARGLGASPPRSFPCPLLALRWPSSPGLCSRACSQFTSVPACKLLVDSMCASSAA